MGKRKGREEEGGGAWLFVVLVGRNVIILLPWIDPGSSSIIYHYHHPSQNENSESSTCICVDISAGDITISFSRKVHDNK